MPTKKSPSLEERVRAALSARTALRSPPVEKKLMGKLAFLVDGSICCSVGTEGLLVRVRPEDRERVLAMPHVTPMKLGARTMKGFVRVAAEAVGSDEALVRWLELGLAAAA